MPRVAAQELADCDKYKYFPDLSVKNGSKVTSDIHNSCKVYFVLDPMTC